MSEAILLVAVIAGAAWFLKQGIAAQVPAAAPTEVTPTPTTTPQVPIDYGAIGIPVEQPYQPITATPYQPPTSEEMAAAAAYYTKVTGRPASFTAGLIQRPTYRAPPLTEEQLRAYRKRAVFEGIRRMRQIRRS